MKNPTKHNAVEELESPFLHLTSFKQQPEIAIVEQNTTPAHTPFKSVYELEGEVQADHAEHEIFVELMDELYDEEFDELLHEIANEARDLYESQITHRYGSLQNYEARIGQSVEEHFAPFINEVERFMDHMVGIAEQHDTQNMTDVEWEGLVDQYIPQMETSPVFENFGGWLKKTWKKVKKVAKVAKRAVKKGVNLAKKFGLGWIIKRMKRPVIKFLRNLLRKAINKLPKKIRPLAKKVAKRLGVLREVNEYDEHEVDFQQELDGMLAEVLLATNETEITAIEQEFIYEADGYVENPLDQLDEARESFVEELGELQEGENPQPAIENFLPAILTGLKWGIRIIGRDRVKRVATGIIAKLIQRFIGKKNARTLAKHAIDTGFKLLNLEANPEQEVESGNRVIATVVEDTVKQIAQLPDHILQNEILLEHNIVQAFETAAKANLPDILPEESYIKRPGLREANKHHVFWKMKGLGNGKRKKGRYKKLNKEIETELTPYLAEEIKTYGGIPLGTVLRDQMGVVVNKRMPVKVHLYETLAGADRSYIGKNEAVISGQGNIALRQIHPLTSVAAGLLMGEPALGCKSKTKCLSKTTGTSSHRYYYLEIPGARPQMYLAPSGVQYLRKTSGLRVKLNFIRRQIQLFLFLSESDAQSIAAQIRQRMESNAAQLSTMALDSGLKIAFSRHATDNIKIVHPNVVPGKGSGMAMNYIPAALQHKLKNKLNDWVSQSLSEHIMNNADEFVRAADSDADGVTVCITMETPEDLTIMGQLINFRKVQIPENIFPENVLKMHITAKPGYHYD